MSRLVPALPPAPTIPGVAAVLQLVPVAELPLVAPVQVASAANAWMVKARIADMDTMLLPSSWEGFLFMIRILKKLRHPVTSRKLVSSGFGSLRHRAAGRMDEAARFPNRAASFPPFADRPVKAVGEDPL